MSDLYTGDSIHLSDIKLPKGVSSVILMQGEGHDQAVASIHMPRGEKVEESEESPAEEGSEKE